MASAGFLIAAAPSINCINKKMSWFTLTITKLHTIAPGKFDWPALPKIELTKDPRQRGETAP
jgi:hypothetical protein